jgi:hypothetical protein
MPSSVASLDTTGSDDSFDEEEYRLAQEEWEESLEQLQQLVSIVLLPFLGKWLGRRWSHLGMSSFPILAVTSRCLRLTIAYARYLRLGLGKTFFLGERRTS